MHSTDRKNDRSGQPSGRDARGGGLSRRTFLHNAGLVAVAGAGTPAAERMLRAAGGPAADASETVTLAVDGGARGRTIPQDFTGLSFERGILNSGNAGVSGYFFDKANTQAVRLFRNAGIKNVRIGGNTVDQQIPAGTGSDGYTGVDNLFAFASAAGANVIYSLRLWNPSANPIPNLTADDVAAVKYISQRYGRLVSSYAIGNEPDWHSFHINDPAIFETNPQEPGSAYPSYLDDWRKFSGTIQGAVHNVKFSGPDTGNYGTRGGLPYVTFTPDMATGVSWTEKFADDEGGSGLITDATQHFYVGGSPFDTTAAQAIENMLSAEWVEATEIGTQPTGTGTGTTAYVPYPWLNSKIVAPVVAAGLPVRLTESNDYLTGIPGASDAFAAALWALDYMHWWAARGVSGVNFHNKQWIWTDTVTPALGTFVPDPGSCGGSACGDYRVSPKGYAIKAFDLGARGEVKPVSASKPDDLNLTAYAAGGGADLYVTVVNKTYGDGATDAQVTIVPSRFAATDAAALTVEAGEPGDPASQTATIGGAAITNDAPWQGKWTGLRLDRQGRVTVTVAATTAAVVRLSR